MIWWHRIKNWECKVSGIICGNISAYSWWGWEKIRSTLLQRVSVTGEIWTWLHVDLMECKKERTLIKIQILMEVQFFKYLKCKQFDYLYCAYMHCAVVTFNCIIFISLFVIIFPVPTITTWFQNVVWTSSEIYVALPWEHCQNSRHSFPVNYS